MQNANKFPEPDPLTADEFDAWRAFLRTHSTVTNELDRELREHHALSLDQYGILITLVGASEMQLRMGELGRRRLISASKISRAVDELERRGLVRRTADDQDRRSLLAGLTLDGLRTLRKAQVTHHRVVRGRMLSRLSEGQLRQLSALLEAAMPGAVSADVWPPTPR